MLLQTNTETNTHGELLAALIENARLSVLCSGWIKLSGLDVLRPAIEAALSKGAEIVVYSNRKDTKRGVAGELAKLAARGLTHHIIDHPTRALHTKIYYFESGDRYTVLIGSANITGGGLRSNEELSVHLTGTKGDQLSHQVQSYLDKLASLR